MALSGRRTYVGFGFGAIQAGLFLHEAYRSGAFGRLVVAEVLPERVASIRQAGGIFAINIAHADGIEQATIGPVEIYDPAMAADQVRLIEAIAEAEELGTAIPSVDLYCTAGPGSIHRLLAAGLEAKVAQSGPPAVVYAAENDNRAAQRLAQAVDEALPAAMREPSHGCMRFLNTVIGKMSGVVPAGNGLLPVTPDDDMAFLVEAFNRILISQVGHDRPFQRGITVFEEKVQLLPFEEAKLYGHNAGHAVAAYLAMAIGVERIADLAAAPGAMSTVRAAMYDEAGAALVQKYAGLDPLFSTAGMAAYVDDLLARMVNPYLRDTAARVGRDPARKLGWDDRLVGAMRLALDQGIAPHRLAMGAAAAFRILRQESGAASIPGRLCELWGETEGDPAQREQILTVVESGERTLSAWLASTTDAVPGFTRTKGEEPLAKQGSDDRAEDMDTSRGGQTTISSESRRDLIIEALREQDSVTVSELSKRLGVTEVTTRKDLQLLEEQGYLTRVRGGAVMSGRGQLELRFAARQQLFLDEKRHIAARSVRYIESGQTIFLDGSSTVFQMTRLLRDRQNLTVITNGLYAALELSFAPGITTIVVGGILRRRTSSLVDMLSPNLLRRLHVDLAFLSCRGYTLANGMMESDLREAQLKRSMASAAKRTIALIDHSKFEQPYTASSLLPEEIDLLISDTSLAERHREEIIAAGIELELA